MEKNTLQNALNEFSQGTTDNIDSIMIKDANGNQYWIEKADLASVLGELIGLKLCKKIDETVILGNGSIEIGEFNGLI